jgi:basic amino acid/polyamine antiporter, APA family
MNRSLSAHPCPPSTTLRPILGVTFGIAVTVGSTIGVGILRTPGSVAALMGTPVLVLLVWLLGGCYALLGANYTAELATMLPKAGGPYVFAHRAYGEFAGFVIGLCDWVLNTAAIAFLAIAFGEYVTRLVPLMAPYSRVVSIAVLIAFTIVNTRGTRTGSHTQQATSLLKASALAAFVVACLASGRAIDARHVAAPAPASIAEGLGALALAFQLVLGAYGGWNAAAYFAEEQTAPAQTAPRSLFWGVLAVTAAYVLVNIGLLAVLPLPALAASTLPASDAMHAMFGELAGMLVTLLSLVLLVSIINAGFLTIPRTLFAAGRDGLVSRRLAAVNTGGTPIAALLVTGAAAMLLSVTGTFERLLAFYAIIGIIINIALVAALFVLRRREPTLSRPFKAWGYPYAPLALLAIDVVLVGSLAVADTANTILAAMLLPASYPLYRLLKARS